LTRAQQLHGRAIGQFDETALVDGHNCRGAGFHQRLQPLLRLGAETAVTHQLSHEQSASCQRQGFERQPNERLIERAEDLGQAGA